MPTPLHLAVALDGAGWHPAAWREPDARPHDLLTAGYWVDLAQEAERGLLDLVTIEDGLRLQSDRPFAPDQRTDRVRGRLDAVVTHTEPFHLSKAIATLDHVSEGRAGVRVQVSGRADEAAHFGRREIAPIRVAALDDPVVQQTVVELFDEAAAYVEVLRRLWDSWEDDAEIRDVATGRFIDRDRLHYIDLESRWFSVRGPSITPRPLQGQPVVAALGHAAVPYRLIGRSTDLGFVTPTDSGNARDLVAAVRNEQLAAGREDDTVHVFADLVVALDDTEAAARARVARLDERAGSPYVSDARTVTGTPAQLADLLEEWQGAGIAGFRLRPAALPHDLRQITRALVPELQRRGLFRTAYEASTLRGHLGLTHPTSRYAGQTSAGRQESR